MKLVNIFCGSVFHLLTIIFVLIYFLGILNTYFSDNNNYCDMTYMFEYPQFVRITVPENKKYPQYALYAYGEGRITEKARKMWFDGIPVLFLPGNAGYHKQGRSLASVALRKALSHDYHFDFFTVNFNEDLSGIYGGVLESETEFASACISKILSLYKNNKYTKTIPTSVILIGHSMGGLIAKRLLAYPNTLNTSNIAITLAAPLIAPVINTDVAMNNFYKVIEYEWDLLNRGEERKRKKVLLSFGNGAKDKLVPAGLTASTDSDISALITAIPGVWVSPDHVSIVWCKQFVIRVTKFLFSIVDHQSKQVNEDKQHLLKIAKSHFQAYRSMTLNPEMVHANVTMIPDGFWYEDNRRLYQISRPEISKTTYLMIRLVKFPQHRFAAIESVNVDDKDWIFGCNAEFTYGTHRYCKQATSLTELTRWLAAARTFGERKLATIHLHDLMKLHPSWSHVLVKVSPTRSPVILNVDINDYSSRQIIVDLPSGLSFGKYIVKEETDADSVYYELILAGFEYIYQAYYLYVETTPSCKATQYHVSAELHVPWAVNHEYNHYFTQAKRTPMKLRLFTSNPNVTRGTTASEHVKIVLVLDPQCTYTISISTSWYHRLSQMARNYTPVLIPYISAIALLVVRTNIIRLQQRQSCVSVHVCLMAEGAKLLYPLLFSVLGVKVASSVPSLRFIMESASSNNIELMYFSQSWLVLPAYMTALGLFLVLLTGVLALMVFSSQLLNRMLLRIVFRGGPTIAERVAAGLQKVPMVVSAALVCAVPLSCGAAALVAGAVFYAFMLSKMYEEYLEDYVYKLMAKIASIVCRLFKSKKNNAESHDTSVELLKSSEQTDSLEMKSMQEGNIKLALKAIEGKEEKNDVELKDNEINVSVMEVDTESKNKSETEETKAESEIKINEVKSKETQALLPAPENAVEVLEQNNDVCEESKVKSKRRKSDHELNEELNSLNFHMMMFLLWVIVTLVNIPALLTWARNFKYAMLLTPDTSYYSGLTMSVCSAYIWQIGGPQVNLRYYEPLAALIFTMAVCILALGPLQLYTVNHGITLIFAVISIQQMCDSDDKSNTDAPSTEDDESKTSNQSESEIKSDENSEDASVKNDQTQDNPEAGPSSECFCNENRIYNVFKNIKDKFSYTEDL